MVIPRDYWQQHPAPVFRTCVIAASERYPFHIAELNEQAQRVVAAALEVPVVGGSPADARKALEELSMSRISCF